MSYVLYGILIVCIVGYFYRKINKKSPCSSETKQKHENVDSKEDAFKELKNTVESTGKIKIVDEIKLTDKNKIDVLTKIDIRKLEVTLENLPDVIEMYRPNEVTMETIKSFAKDIYNHQVEPLAYSTIYKYIANSYGYRTWLDFRKNIDTIIRGRT